ncbi:MAG: glucosamine-6-phosphate deaminase [Eubacteriales bacterium]
MRTFECGKLHVEIHPTRDAMGAAAAAAIHARMLALFSEREEINMIFAAAPSQNETLASLLTYPDIPWERVNAFHMDEYIGLPESAPQRFGNYLREHIFERAPFGRVFYIDSGAPDVDAECARYTALLREYPTDIVCMGIGENGHIAFNDPGVADFADPLTIKPVPLDDICRMQQVHDGCFARLEDVPTHALTLTVPTLLRGRYLFCSVPARTKAEAVREMLTTDKIDEHCPAAALRQHPNAALYCDADSASLLP